MNSKSASMMIAMLLAFSTPLLLLTSSRAGADGGFHYSLVGTHVIEGTQYAIASWDGERETLYIQTSARTTAPVESIRLVPFPANITVAPGPADVFRNLSRLVEDKAEELGITDDDRENSAAQGFDAESTGGSSERVSITILSFQTFGRTDVLVMKVDDVKGLTSMMDNLYRSYGFEGAIYNETFTSIIQDYLDRGIAYFALSYVNMSVAGADIATDVLAYEFETDCLYYPMIISYIGGPVVGVQLFTITSRYLDQEEFNDFLLHDRIGVPVSDGELASLDGRLGGMFEGGAYCTIWVNNLYYEYLRRGTDVDPDNLAVQEEAVREHKDIMADEFLPVLPPDMLRYSLVSLFLFAALGGSALLLFRMKSMGREAVSKTGEGKFPAA